MQSLLLLHFGSHLPAEHRSLQGQSLARVQVAGCAPQLPERQAGPLALPVQSQLVTHWPGGRPELPPLLPLEPLPVEPPLVEPPEPEPAVHVPATQVWEPRQSAFVWQSTQTPLGSQLPASSARAQS